MAILSRDYVVSWEGADGRWYTRIDNDVAGQPSPTTNH